MTASLILTTYNRPAALAPVLASVAALDPAPLEVLVADDGSDARTATVIAHARAHLRIPLTHVWQPDLGFRAAASRNRAAALAKGALLVFVDGDCLLRKQLIGEHLRLAEPGYTVAGNRILLSESLTAAIERGEADPLGWGSEQWKAARARGEIGRLFPLRTLPGHWWRKLRSRDWLSFRTCNVAVWREDFVGVNGFEERISGWGFEDSDLVIRLLNAGIRIKSGRFATAVLHLWHPESPRDAADRNRRLALQAFGEKRVRAELGLAERVAQAQADWHEPPLAQADRADPPDSQAGRREPPFSRACRS